MTTVLHRNPLTAAVIAACEVVGFPVGDGIIPKGGNWSGGVNEPGATFRPYAVVSEIVASHSSGPIGDSQADWQVPYLIESFGVLRAQCGALAERLRDALTAMRGRTFVLGAASYGVQQVRVDSLGAPARIDQEEPALWHSQTGITIWLGKTT